ncbi:MAG: GT4 family glycosyltransferase PelF [Gammaproteobacteria bacterium]|nr:GT4 family glycosyltransferase PelF [Gammaproteobacteria bacterium]
MPDNGASFRRNDRFIDVMLLLEGTYPFVSGGVSSWMHQIIKGFPHLCFGGVFLGSQPEDYKGLRYQLPENFVYLKVVYLFSSTDKTEAVEQPMKHTVQMQISNMHQCFRQRMECNNLTDQVTSLLDLALLDGSLNKNVFLHSQGAWNFLSQNYRQFCTDPSFVDYFWTVRGMHTPIWILNELTLSTEPARMYHTISTGYAGFLGALMSHRHKRPLLISEHGIYTKERKIDLYQVDWIKDNRDFFQNDYSEVAYFKQMWIRFFEVLARIAYEQAYAIISLYETNRQRQISDGADPDKTQTIPNGIDLPKFAAQRCKRPNELPKVACLIGRVVPIKDIKTFIRSMRTVVNRLPNAQGWIAGPEDEDKSYAQECRQLVQSLGLTENVTFLGFQKVEELLPKVGVTVLSSISEALPLVLLEGFAAGVPSVATDVGSCKQLIYGYTEEDNALGAAGRVVRIADPQAMSESILELLTDDEAWKSASAAGIARVEKYYTQSLMLEQYHQRYEEGLKWQE